MISSENKNVNNERLSVRRDILETFNVFLMMPHHGKEKIVIADVSETGLAFLSVSGMHISEESLLDSYFYININVRIPIKLKVVYRKEECGVEKIGCEVVNKETRAYGAFLNFIELLHSLSYFVDI